MNLQNIIRIKDKIKLIAEQHGAKNIGVFGSVVRGQEHQGSDVDFLVDMDSDRDLFDLMDLQEELSNEIGVSVDVVTRASLNRHIKEIVMREAMSL